MRLLEPSLAGQTIVVGGKLRLVILAMLSLCVVECNVCDVMTFIVRQDRSDANSLAV